MRPNATVNLYRQSDAWPHNGMHENHKRKKKHTQTMNVSHDMNKTTLFELDEKKIINRPYRVCGRVTSEYSYDNGLWWSFNLFISSFIPGQQL